MSEKQDRAAVRTAAQLEQKYSFGKRFSEILGLIDDTRDKVDSAVSGLHDEITQTSTELSRTTEEISMKVNTMVENGVERVTTTTGYTFNSAGLRISKSGEQVSNLLDNTGMYVKRSTYGGMEEEVLAANNKGVTAINLHAKEYLIVGEGNGRSRFEDYGDFRTGCFWIGG